MSRLLAIFLTLTELRYIVAVAREKHFGRAAEACFVSQPTLSVAITEVATRGKDPLNGPLRLGIIHTIGPYLLPGMVVGLLHGRMPAAEKTAVMAQFAGGQMAVLVATTVIEHAERFGLSQLHQLHQLRGRVGRGAVASVCVLLYQSPLSPTGKDRLRAMAETTDGFEIARRDLEIRGPGELMGARQSGDALLRFADLAEDVPLLQQARQVAQHLLELHPLQARAHVNRWLDTRADYLNARSPSIPPHLGGGDLQVREVQGVLRLVNLSHCSHSRLLVASRPQPRRRRLLVVNHCTTNP